MIQAIIFDCFGVLTTDIWLAFLDSLPATVDRRAARDLNRAYDSGIISQQEFIDGVRDVTGQTPPEVEKMHAAEVIKNEPLLAMIRDLKKTYRIGLLSNISSDWITRELLTSEEQELFDEMVFSYQVGMIKPDPRIYMLMCERLRVSPHEALMIDDRAAFIEASRAEGLAGITYENLSSFKAQLNELLNTDY